MKAHEKLAADIKEQQQLITALERHLRFGIPERRQAIHVEIARLQAELVKLDDDVQNIPHRIVSATEQLQKLLNARLVMETPALKKLKRLMKQVNELKEELGDTTDLQ